MWRCEKGTKTAADFVAYYKTVPYLSVLNDISDEVFRFEFFDT